MGTVRTALVGATAGAVGGSLVFGVLQEIDSQSGYWFGGSASALRAWMVVALIIGFIFGTILGAVIGLLTGILKATTPVATLIGALAGLAALVLGFILYGRPYPGDTINLLWNASLVPGGALIGLLTGLFRNRKRAER
jgi:hypothetical protein